MRIAVAVAAVLLFGACTTDSDPDVRVERQSTTVAGANASRWAEGGAVMVGVPGTFAFPQPLSLRISLVDNLILTADGAPTQLDITSATIATYGSTTELQVVTPPTCAANFCTAELKVMAAGQSMLTVTGDGPGGKLHDCFYYGVYEDADPTAVGDEHRTELEAQQKDCVAAFWK